MPQLNPKISALEPSPTLAITAKASELRQQGKNILSLSAGEPDFDTPENIKNAGFEAIQSGKTKYTPVDGSKELKEAIQHKLSSENGLDYDLPELMASSGGKQLIFNAFMASLTEQDEVIIPAPYWVTYPAIINMFGAKITSPETNAADGFKLTPAQLEAAISDKTKWLILNSPNNPTGAVYSQEELKQLAEVLKKYPHVNILSDEIYEHILYTEEPFVNIVNVAPELKSRTLIVNGVSKAYSMTGWRLGYGAANKELIAAMKKIQSHSTSNPCSISQAAGVEALSGTQHFIQPNILGFKQKRDLVESYLNYIKAMDVLSPEGAFYIFPSCYRYFGYKTPNNNKINNSIDFCSYLLEEAEVAAVPGAAFGREGYFRISYATSEQILADACSRISDFCSKLK